MVQLLKEEKIVTHSMNVSLLHGIVRPNFFDLLAFVFVLEVCTNKHTFLLFVS